MPVNSTIIDPMAGYDWNAFQKAQDAAVKRQSVEMENAYRGMQMVQDLQKQQREAQLEQFQNALGTVEYPVDVNAPLPSSKDIWQQTIQINPAIAEYTNRNPKDVGRLKTVVTNKYEQDYANRLAIAKEQAAIRKMEKPEIREASEKNEALSSSMYGKRFYELTPSEQGEVLKAASEKSEKEATSQTVLDERAAKALGITDPVKIAEYVAQKSLERSGQKAKTAADVKAAIDKGQTPSDEDLAIPVQNYLQKGVLVPGMKSKATNDRIISLAAKYARDNNIDPTTIPATEAAFKGDQVAYSASAKKYRLTSQSESQAEKMATLLESSNKEYIRGTYKLPNQVRAWYKGQINDPKLADFSTKLLAFATEYKKVTTGAAMSVAELSTSAQEQVDKWLSAADSWESLDAKVKAAKQEMKATNESNYEGLMQQRKDMENIFGIKEDLPPRKVGEIPKTSEWKFVDGVWRLGK